ncbi:YfcE family phosphodiesterase [candidate division WWE3 bacterium]|uniref:Phosphoesterase n=1 Tax=candidate division WWE3 bacterium TaxID=2053526 RepID=A0A955RRM2_UNCKA|nr:YfcE family phosphodiesterase [candidate division WWE3 bacterium]
MQKVLDWASQNPVEAVIACGDYCAPFIGSYLKEINVPTYACLGNNDEDHIGLQKQAGENVTWFHLSQEYGEVELDGKKIAFCHYPRLAELLAQSGDYDAVFHGHTHKVRNEVVGRTLLVNPGSICGIVNAKPAQASFGVYDTVENNVEIIEL